MKLARNKLGSGGAVISRCAISRPHSISRQWRGMPRHQQGQSAARRGKRRNQPMASALAASPPIIHRHQSTRQSPCCKRPRLEAISFSGATRAPNRPLAARKHRGGADRHGAGAEAAALSREVGDAIINEMPIAYNRPRRPKSEIAVLRQGGGEAPSAASRPSTSRHLAHLGA